MSFQLFLCLLFLNCFIFSPWWCCWRKTCHWETTPPSLLWNWSGMVPVSSFFFFLQTQAQNSLNLPLSSHACYTIYTCFFNTSYKSSRYLTRSCYIPEKIFGFLKVHCWIFPWSNPLVCRFVHHDVWKKDRLQGETRIHCLHYRCNISYTLSLSPYLTFFLYIQMGLEQI